MCEGGEKVYVNVGMMAFISAIEMRNISIYLHNGATYVVRSGRQRKSGYSHQAVEHALRAA